MLGIESSGRLGRTSAGPRSFRGPAGYLRALYLVDKVLGLSWRKT
jgi:hypothetical protein